MKPSGKNERREKKMNKKLTKVLILCLSFLVIFSTVAWGQQEKKDGHFTVVDKEGNVVFQTAMPVHKGDWYITENNKKYTITEINADQVTAKYEGTIDLISNGDDFSSSILQSGILSAQKDEKKVAVYNTHTDESYVPSSGSESEPGNGDVYEVSDTFAKKLRERGTKVYESNSKHGPHDGGAYDRSRRTAKKLVEKRPDAVFDIHRDGVPDKSEYLTKINGKQVSKISLVVGRQNPNMKNNDSFAKQLKAVSDRMYPGLIKGIHYAKGKYNQDIGPRTMLLEMGTHVVSKEQAKNSAALFAGVVDQALYGQEKQAQGAKEAKQGQNTSALGSLLLILAASIVGIIGYLFINEGSWEGVVKRIKQFFGAEFVNFLGYKKEDIKKDDQENDAGEDEKE